MMSAVGSNDDVLTREDIVAIHDFEASDHFSELEKAVLRYATEMSSTPVRIDDDNFAILKENFSEKQLVELTANIAWENHRARFDHAFGIGSGGFYK